MTDPYPVSKGINSLFLKYFEFESATNARIRPTIVIVKIKTIITANRPGELL